ncbi:MAG: hypothetical protein ABI587_06520 [Gemmatimonadales bacterium]
MRGIFVLLALLAAGVRTLRAQDSTAAVTDDSLRTEPDSAFVPDNVVYDSAAAAAVARTPVSPMGGLWRSLLIPGWGQAKLNRKLTGALFITWEGVTLGMSIKTAHELRYLERTHSTSIASKRQEKQDWLVLLAFNHLFAGVEAFVAAHLWDFPEDLQVSASPLPEGGFGASVRLPVRFP